jgi:phosphoribosylanthranilate isomerase
MSSWIGIIFQKMQYRNLSNNQIRKLLKLKKKQQEAIFQVMKVSAIFQTMKLDNSYRIWRNNSNGNENHEIFQMINDSQRRTL